MGVNSRGEGASRLLSILFAENCMKIKKIRLRGGARDIPSRSATGMCHSKGCFTPQRVCIIHFL